MSVVNGQDANQDTFNNAFVSKTSVTSNIVTGIVEMANGGSGAAITNLQQSVNDKIPLTEKGAANGVAELDGSGLVPSSQLPSYVDDVLEFANLAAFPVTGETGKIYVAIDTGFCYRWTGSAYLLISHFDPSIIDADLVPDTDNARKIGSTTKNWSEVHTKSILSSTDILLEANTGSQSINLEAINIKPTITENTDLGTSTERFFEAHAASLFTDIIDSPTGTPLQILSETGTAQLSIGATALRPSTANDKDLGATTHPWDKLYVNTIDSQTVTLEFLGRSVKIPTAGSDPLTPTAGELYYNNTVGKLRYYDDLNSVWSDVGSGGGGGGFGEVSVLLEDGDNSALDVFVQGFPAKEFTAAQAQNLYGFFKVPEGYTAGTEIKLKVTVKATVNNNFTLVCDSYLTGAVSSPNFFNGTPNTDSATQTGDATYIQNFEFSLTSPTGEINSVAVAAGDVIAIELYENSLSVTDFYVFPRSAVAYV